MEEKKEEEMLMERKTVWQSDKGEKKKLYPDDSEEIFYGGLTFYKTATKIKGTRFDYEGNKGNLIIPYIVNLSFAAELFLKSMLVASGKDVGNKHDWWILYSEISNSDVKDRIKNACPVLKDVGGVDISFENLLKDIGETFLYWRYAYERMNPIASLTFIEAFTNIVMEEAQKMKIVKK